MCTGFACGLDAVAGVGAVEFVAVAVAVAVAGVAEEKCGRCLEVDVLVSLKLQLAFS